MRSKIVWMLIPLSSSKPKSNNGGRHVNRSWGSSRTIPKLMKKRMRHEFIYLHVLLENLDNTLSLKMQTQHFGIPFHLSLPLEVTSGGLHVLNDQQSNTTIAKYNEAIESDKTNFESSCLVHLQFLYKMHFSKIDRHNWNKKIQDFYCSRWGSQLSLAYDREPIYSDKLFEAKHSPFA